MSRVIGNLVGIQVDRAYRIADRQAVSVVHQLLREEGCLVGLASVLNLVGAFRLARQRGAGRVITVLSDSGYRYLSIWFNSEWLGRRGLDPKLAIESSLECTT